MLLTCIIFIQCLPNNSITSEHQSMRCCTETCTCNTVKQHCRSEGEILDTRSNTVKSKNNR